MSNKKKKYEIKIGSNNLPKLSVFTHATNEKEAVENYIKYVVNGLGLAEIFQVDDNDIIESIHQTFIGSDEYKSVKQDRFHDSWHETIREHSKKIGDKNYTTCESIEDLEKKRRERNSSWNRRSL